MINTNTDCTIVKFNDCLIKYKKQGKALKRILKVQRDGAASLQEVFKLH